MSNPPALTPVEVNLLTGTDMQAGDHKAAILNATERAQSALHFDMLPLARERLNQALAELDALETRLTEIRGQR